MESSQYTRGAQLFGLGRYQEAIKAFKSELSMNPDDDYSKYYLALCYINLDDFNQAEDLVKSSLSSNPNFSETHYLNSIIQLQKDKHKEALKAINLAINLAPYDSDNFGQKASILLVMKDYQAALNAANEGLAIDAKNVHCLNTRTQALTKLNKKEEAFETLQNTLGDNPEDEYTHANAGWTNLEIGNHKDAKEHFKEALRLNPNNEYARQGMVEAIKAQNFIYRSFLKYAFWIQNKARGQQWLYIIGIYVLYRISYKFFDSIGLTYIAPIIAVVYISFALGSWLITPISNAILLFNNYGKYLLDSRAKESGLLLISLAAISLVSVGIFYSLNIDAFLTISLTALFTILPLTHSRHFANKNSRIIGLIYGIVMVGIGVTNALFLGNQYFFTFAVFIMMVAYTWLSGLLQD